MKFAGIILATAVLASAPALAQVEAKSAWVRGTVGAQKTTGAYMEITSAQGGSLVSAESASAATVEVHEMRMEGNVMRMRAVPRLDLPAGKTVALKPGGYHIMLIDLKKPLKEGENVAISVTFEDGSSKKFDAQVRKVQAMMPMSMPMPMDHDHMHMQQ